MALNRRISLWASLAISVALMCAVAAPPAVGEAGEGMRAAPATAAAPTFNVNSFIDAVADFSSDPDFTMCHTIVAITCTLRAAIMNANRTAGGGATINLPAGTYVLSLAPAGPNDDATGDLNITNTVTIAGAGAASTIVDAAQIDRVFNISAGTMVSLSDITIRNGAAFDAGGLINAGNLTLIRSTVSGNNATAAVGHGGGIWNTSTGELTVSYSTISGNTANNSSGQGGGIFNYGKLTVNNSTLSGNSAQSYGGGIYSDGFFGGVLTMTNSTIQGNSVQFGGGGLANWSGTALIFHSTIAGNLADHDGSGTGSGGGIYNFSGQVGLWNTLLAENYVSSTANECGNGSPLYPLTSHDYNFYQTTAGCTISGTAPNDISSGNPLLGPLQDNGGQTFTRALWVGSPAIGQIPPGLCRDAAGNAPVPDQRGVARPVGPKCDIGAYDGAQPTPLFNGNLIRNGDAENAAGSPTGAYVGTPSWLLSTGEFTAVPYNSPGGFPSVPTDTVPANHGSNFFAGGNATPSAAYQNVDVSALSGAIDSGNVKYTLSGDLGGYADQDDNATLTATFLDVNISPIISVTIGPVMAADRGCPSDCKTGLLHRGVTGLVPAGTRLIRVVVNMTAVSGGYNDGYADNLSLVLTPPTLFLPLVMR